jgi:uncharacterized protein YndB with AHSA1/START domain
MAFLFVIRRQPLARIDRAIRQFCLSLCYDEAGQVENKSRIVRPAQVSSNQMNTRKPTIDSAKNRIEKKVWIKASAEVVFGALTDSRELGHWFCDRAVSTPREGGEFRAYWKAGKSGQEGQAIFTRFVPNSAVELLWIDEGRGTGEGSSRHTLSYSIRSKSGMTEVVMVDTDDPVSDEETYDILERGWNSVLLELKDYCERRERSGKVRLDSKSRPPQPSSR